MNNIALEFITNDLRSKLSAQSMAFYFNAANLCIRTDTLQLINVEVPVGGSTVKIEEACKIKQEDDKHFILVTFNPELIPSIMRGVLSVHPEVKLEKQDDDDDDNEEKPYIIEMWMPKIDKNRRDAMKKALDVRYEQIHPHMEATYSEAVVNLTTVSGKLKPGDVSKAKEEMEQIHKDYIEIVEQERDDLKKYLDEEYAKNEAESRADEAQNNDAGQKMML